MYESFFELKCKPFSLLPDPDFLFLSSRHSVALSLLEYSLTGQAGFCVITGDIGSGKTTLVRAFLGRVGREFSVGLISNTHAQVRDIAGWALTAFGQKQSSNNPAEVYQELMAYLIAEYGAGRQCILIVDEAQNLSIEALEELRLLSNINSGKDLLLQILLVGQPELLEKLKQPELRQFAQRIAVSHHLSPLSFAETRKYIGHRLAVAGATDPIFTEMAIGAIQYFSGGVPRLINSICDLCLVYAFADGVREVDEALVFRVITDRQLSGIAPFANTKAVDDPAVREEISVIAQSDKSEPRPLEKTAAAPPAVEPKAIPVAVTPAAPPAAEPKPIAIHKDEAIEPRGAAPVPTGGAGEAPSVRIAEPISLSTAPRRSPQDRAAAGTPPSAPELQVEPPADEYYFDGEESDLLLTSEVEGDEADAPGARNPQDELMNGARHSRVVMLRADSGDRLVTAAARTHGGKSDTERQFPVIEGDRVGSTGGGDSLRLEETLLEATPSGTPKHAERSWWRRAFRRGG
jgi:type II secretory pathway predicted ATPase ExeA